jgi:rhodanese-related sulfurtransferase
MGTRSTGWLAFLVLATLPVLGADTPSGTPSVTRRIGIEEYEKLRANTNVVILDVRSKSEFDKGRIPGAINIDINSTRFADAASALDKSKAYLVNCAVGMRSAKACKKMETMGFTNLFDLSPGFDGWKKAGRPVEKEK